MEPKPSSLDSSKGATILELLVGLLVSTMIVLGIVSLAFRSEALFQTSERRSMMNQTLRGAVDVIGNEIREAGVRLPEDFVAIEIVDGAFGLPDELVLRRNMSSTVMPLCSDLTAGAARANVAIADGGGTPTAGCTPGADDDGNGWPDNMEAWKTRRTGKGGTMRAYVYDPIARDGEFFELDGEDETTFTLDAGVSGTWTNSYSAAALSRVYVLEERRIRLTGDLLESVVDDGGGGTLGIAENIQDFQVRAILADGTILNTVTNANDWADVETIEVTLSALVTEDGRTMTREIVTRFNPRNVLSL